MGNQKKLTPEHALTINIDNLTIEAAVDKMYHQTIFALEANKEKQISSPSRK